MKQSIFITGANGFIGKTMVEHFSDMGYEVFALIRPNTLPRFLLKPNIHPCYGDLRIKDSLMKALPQKSVVLNLAANPYDKRLSHEVNVLGTENLLGVARTKKSSLFIQVSSQATKIEHKGVYATTKLKSDELVRPSGVPFVILKPSLVYGGGSRGLFSKIASLMKKIPFTPVFGDGNIPLYPIHVEDLATLTQKIAEMSGSLGETLDIGGPTKVTYNQLYEAIAKHSGSQTSLVHIPTTIGILLARLFSFLPHPPFYEDNILGSTQQTHCKPFAVHRKYKFIPRSFQDGIREVFHPNTLSVCLVGLGKMGMLHATMLRAFADVTISALVDTNPKLYSTFQSMGIQGNFYRSFEEALEHENFDAVYITTPTFAHIALLQTALKHKKHVFIEKPLALNEKQLSSVDKMKHSPVVRVGYTMLYHRTFAELARIVQEERYGKIKRFTATFEHGEVFEPQKGWMFSKELSGGGVMMNPGPHMFSILFSCFGVPKTVSATLYQLYSKDIEDKATVHLEYPSMKGEVALSWSVKGVDVARYEVRVECERATVTANSKEVRIQPKRGKTLIQQFSHLMPPKASTFTINPDAFGEAYYFETADFLEAIRLSKTKQKPAQQSPNGLEQARGIERIIHRAYSNGRWSW